MSVILRELEYQPWERVDIQRNAKDDSVNITVWTDETVELQPKVYNAVRQLKVEGWAITCIDEEEGEYPGIKIRACQAPVLDSPHT